MPMPSLRRLATFASVGAIATVAYGIIAESLVFFGLKLLWASLIAYAVSATWSYLGHKYFTFASSGKHVIEAPRFILTTGVGLLIAVGMPTLIAKLFGPSPYVAVLATCILVPIISFVASQRFVFRSAA
jgi:putative flippase GtrA